MSQDRAKIGLGVGTGVLLLIYLLGRVIMAWDRSHSEAARREEFQRKMQESAARINSIPPPGNPFPDRYRPAGPGVTPDGFPRAGMNPGPGDPGFPGRFAPPPSLGRP